MLFWIIGIIAFITILFSLTGWWMSAPRYRGERSAHFDGKRFFNPEGEGAKGFYEAMKWMISGRERGEWRRVDNPPATNPLAAPEPDKIRVTFVNHSTFLIQGSGHAILTDPIWSERTSPVSWAGPRRMSNPGVAFDDLPRVDVVLISHNHYDHLDEPTVKRLAEKFDPHFIVPLGVGQFLKSLSIKNVSEFDWGESTTLSDSLKVSVTPARHFSGRGLLDRDATLWCGYMISLGDKNIFFAGDTGYGKFFQKIREDYGPVKIALLPIGAYKPEWFMSPIHVSPEEAVQIHKDLQPELSIGMHFGTFPLADDGREDPLTDLERAKEHSGIAGSAFITLDNGAFIEVQ